MDIVRNNDPVDIFFRNLERSRFLEKDYQELADYDSPLPAGYGQTISQPSLVVQMTKLLKLDKNNKVLEIGTGTGYQTAFLAQFAAEVYSVERIKELSLKAQKRLAEMGYKNIKFKIGDGSEGWSEFAPYDRIIITAAAGKLPEPLLKQLNPEGRMLVPLGEKGVQDLLVIQKDQFENLITESNGKVTFVEFVGDYGWDLERRS